MSTPVDSSTVKTVGVPVSSVDSNLSNDSDSGGSLDIAAIFVDVSGQADNDTGAGIEKHRFAMVRVSRETLASIVTQA